MKAASIVVIPPRRDDGHQGGAREAIAERVLSDLPSVEAGAHPPQSRDVDVARLGAGFARQEAPVVP
jgi:hypothetical protein